MTSHRPAGCVLCGDSQVQLHHLTCRPSPGRPYFDEDLRITLCCRPPRNCHARIHAILRTLEFDFLPDGLDSLAYRVLLVKMHLRMCIDAGVTFVLADESAYRALESLLLEVAGALRTRQERAA